MPADPPIRPARDKARDVEERLAFEHAVADTGGRVSLPWPCPELPDGFAQFAVPRAVSAPAVAGTVAVGACMLPFVAVMAALAWRAFRWAGGL